MNNLEVFLSTADSVVKLFWLFKQYGGIFYYARSSRSISYFNMLSRMRCEKYLITLKHCVLKIAML